MTETLQGLQAANREKIDTLRRGGRFFWIDASVGETSQHELGEVLGVPAPALEALFDFGDRFRTRKFTSDGRHIVFPFSCYLESDQSADTTYRLHPVKVHMLVSREYLLTLHAEQMPLPEQLAPYTPEGCSERYVVYAVLEAMIASTFDALDEVQLNLDEVSVTSSGTRGGRIRVQRLRGMSSRLSGIRREAGPERGVFERIGGELGQLEGLEADRDRFGLVGEQLNRLIDAIDATSGALATQINLRQNETIYWLTVVATIFLPLTFLTGFFGMNFTWMVDQIHSQLAFWLLGVGSLVVGVALIWRLVVRGVPIETDTSNGDAAQRSV
ncbi:MAG: magnesium transporter CorA family protein [Solirubrobacteraceae bacterium]